MILLVSEQHNKTSSILVFCQGSLWKRNKGRRLPREPSEQKLIIETWEQTDTKATKLQGARRGNGKQPL